MAIDAWLPANFTLPDGSLTRATLNVGSDWQLYDTREGQALVCSAALAEHWCSDGLLELQQMSTITIGDQTLYVLSSSAKQALVPLADCLAPSTVKQVSRFADAFRESRKRVSDVSLHDALYVESLGRLLPTYTSSPAITDDIVLGRWLTGGVSVSVSSVSRLRALTSWMGEKNLSENVTRAGLQFDDTPIREIDTHAAQQGDGALLPRVIRAAPRPADGVEFTLVGRPALTQFLREHIIDIIENSERYKALNIDFPSAIILHGPPGCGKTFAIDRLIDYLGWPAFQIDASSVASPYIHDTSKKVAEVFAEAIKNAPSIVIMDEMESFVSDRQMGSGSSSHRVEEVAEFLRRIPEAIQKRVLVIGMTNRIEMIDAAILRRGRFDHVVKVDMPSREEVQVLLEQLLAALPCADNIDIDGAAEQLQGRPLSDVTFAVREAARLAARAGKNAIDAALFEQAINATPSRTDEAETPSRKIGFT